MTDKASNARDFDNIGIRQRVKFLLDKLTELLRFQRPDTAEKMLELSKQEEKQRKAAH